jgi:hypothetical protein
MTRLVITLAFLASCSAPAKPDAKPGSSEAAPIIAKRVAVSWGIEPKGEFADIFLATTDETGKQVSHSLGRYKGICTVAAPGKEMKALTAVDCRTGGTGTELQAVVEHGEYIVVVKLGIDQGVTPDPMARDEVMRVKVPPGAKIEAGT